MSESTSFNHPGLQGRLIYSRTKFWRNALNRQSVVMGDAGLEVGCIGLFSNEGFVCSGNIPDLGMIGCRCHFMAGAQSRGKPTQTTAAGKWGEGVQPEPPEPSARDGGADTKKPANDPAGVAASSGQVEDLGLASGPPKRPGLGWGGACRPVPKQLAAGQGSRRRGGPRRRETCPAESGGPRGPKDRWRREASKGRREASTQGVQPWEHGHSTTVGRRSRRVIDVSPAEVVNDLGAGNQLFNPGKHSYEQSRSASLERQHPSLSPEYTGTEASERRVWLDRLSQIRMADSWWDR